jgi:hypothetical protein
MGDNLASWRVGEPLDAATLRANVVHSRAVQPIEGNSRHPELAELPAPLIESIILTMWAP